MEALRAVRDADTNQGGLKAFRKRLQQGGACFLEDYLRISPGFDELHKIWDHQQTVMHVWPRSSLMRGLAQHALMTAYMHVCRLHHSPPHCVRTLVCRSVACGRLSLLAEVGHETIMQSRHTGVSAGLDGAMAVVL